MSGNQPMGINYGVPTQVDWMSGFAYAFQQVNKMKCQDPDIITSVCQAQGAGGGTCINWVEDKTTQVFPTPSNYYVKPCAKNSDCTMGTCGTNGNCTCTKDSDCTQGMGCLQDPTNPANLICGFAPQNVASGHCKFVTESSCTSQGQLPYTCDDTGYCTSRPQSELNKSYTEWHVDPTSGQGQCILGNFALRQWCENPGSRCTKNPDTGEYPGNCTGGENTPGVTTVPPFYYDRSQGACYMTHDYCNAYGLDYNKSACVYDSDCPGKNNYCVQNNLGLSYCTGPDSECNTSTGDKVAQFFIGKTLFYLFKNNMQCETYTDPTSGQSSNVPEEKDRKINDFSGLLKSFSAELKNIPEMACSQSDPKDIKSKVMIKENFAGQKINLYLISWKNGKVETGFDIPEVEKVYPEVVKKHKNRKMICVSREQAKKDKNLKRIYLTLNIKGWFTDNILRTLEGYKNKKKK